jgi:HPt (histidine-containing phosphotransfer) domain-containing protein
LIPEPILDPAAHEAIRSIGQPALLPRLIALYRAETPKQIAALQTAAKAGDATRLVHLVHTMKSSSRGLGGMRLGAACAHCEAHAEAGRVAEAAALVAVIEREYANFERALTGSRETAAA